MKYEKYNLILISTNTLEFTFVSKGPNGDVQKVVQFIETNNPAIYNLAFGNLLPDGSVDDHVKNDNKDRNKILATVAATVYEFTSMYPDKLVFITGSTTERTRLYRMAISNNFDELNIDFEIFGLYLKGQQYHAESFIKGKEYFGFLIKRKIV